MFLTIWIKSFNNLSFVHHFELLKPLSSSHVQLGLFLFHFLFSFLLPSQCFKACWILKSPFFHQPFILLFFMILILFDLFFSHKIVHHWIVIFFSFLLNRFKFFICLRISLLVFLLCNLKVLWLNYIIFKIDILRKLKVKFRELLSFKVIKIHLLKFKGVIGFIF